MNINGGGMKRTFFLFLIFLSMSPLLFGHAKITLFTFGGLDELLHENSQEGNLASLATLLEEERACAEDSLTILGGNILSPHVLAGLDKGNLLIDILNAMSVDITSVGPHDLDFGKDLLQQRIKESHFSWIASNLLSIDGTALVENETKIYEIQGIKIGFFSLAKPLAKIGVKAPPDLYFASPLYMARQKCKELKKADVDIIIAITQQPLADDLRLLHEVPGIDLLLGRSDRDTISWFENKVFIHRMGDKDSLLTRIDLVIEKHKNHFHQKQLHIYPSFRYVEHKSKTRNAKILEKMEKYYALDRS